MLSLKSTLDRKILGPFRMSLRNEQKQQVLILSQLQSSSMLHADTSRALALMKDPEYKITGPFQTMPQEHRHSARVRCTAKSVLWCSSPTAKSPPLKTKKQLDLRGAATTERNISLHKYGLSFYPIYHSLVLVRYFYDFLS